MSAELKRQAEQAAARVTGVGLDPALVITIITTVLPLLINCFKREDEPDPVRVQAALRKAYERNPDKLRRRVRAQVHRRSPEAVDRGQEFAIADAIIAQGLDTTPRAVSAAVMEVSE